MSYMPKMFHNNLEIQQRVITYLSVHQFKFNFFNNQVRMECPDKTIYHFNGDENKYKMLCGKDGVRIINQPILPCFYFIEFVCNVLALHNPQLIFPTIKILVSFHEKEYVYITKDKFKEKGNVI